jgi:hypothetical protein
VRLNTPMQQNAISRAEVYVVDGKRLETIRISARQPGLPTIVMLHEGLGSVAHWKDFPYQLAEATGAEIFVTGWGLRRARG